MTRHGVQPIPASSGSCSVRECVSGSFVPQQGQRAAMVSGNNTATAMPTHIAAKADQYSPSLNTAAPIRSAGAATSSGAGAALAAKNNRAAITAATPHIPCHPQPR
eukprot:Hpha_TRINITY_DN34912_c0_g1::TRINITY_DN34912_c0_g1_i1::g.184189::m.184189